MPRPKLERRARKSLTSRFTKLENDGRPLERKIVRLLFAGKKLKLAVAAQVAGSAIRPKSCGRGATVGVRAVLSPARFSFADAANLPSDQVTAPAKEELDVRPPPPKGSARLG
jgi:hypothetical protein